MPLTVTSASTSSAQPAAARISSSPTNSFANVLDGTHDASRAAMKPAPQATSQNATTSVDRGSKRRSSDDRRTPSAHPSEPSSPTSPLPPLPAAVPTPTPTLASPLSPVSSISQEPDAGIQATSFDSAVIVASGAKIGPSLAGSPSTVLVAVNASVEATPDASAPDAPPPDTSDDTPAEPLSASDTPSSNPAKPTQATPEPSPAASDIVRQPPPATASSLSLPSGLLASAGATSPALHDLLASTSRAAAADSTHLSPAARPAATSSQTSAGSSSHSPAGPAPLPQILSAPPFAPLPAPSVTPTHGGSPSSGKRSSLSADKTSTTQAAIGADASSSDAASPSPAAPLAAVALNPATSTTTVPSPLPQNLPASPSSHPDPTASKDAAASTPQATTATDPAALSKVDVARLVRSAAGSELRVGVRSEDFGNLTIHATLGRDQLSAHISTESERLGSALTNHLSSIEDTLTDRLGKGLSLRTTVSVGSDTSFAGSDQGREQARQQSSSQTANQTANQTSSSSNGNPSSRYQPFPAAAGISTTQSIAAGATAAYTLASPDRLSIRV